MDRELLTQILGYEQTEEQHAATTAPLIPGVVVAAAGSGKTAVMAARVVWAASQGVPIDSILGLTFTRKAAGELVSRVRALVGSARGVGVDIGDLDAAIFTYNAFAGQILAEHGIRIGLEPGAPVLAAAARAMLAAHVVRSVGDDVLLTGLDESDPLRPSSFPLTLSTWVGHVLKLDDRLSDTAISVDDLQAWDRALLKDLSVVPIRQQRRTTLMTTSRTRLVVAELVRRFRAEKLQRQVVDFADQTRLALDLAAVAEVRQSLRERFALVLLDEYQDTSLAQRMLMQRLFGAGHPLTAVGDPCQAIYGFRGASVDNIDNFRSHFAAEAGGRAELFTLEESRRSGQAILDAANAAASRLREVHPTVGQLRQGDPSKGQGVVRCGLFATAADELAWITAHISDLRADGVPLSEIAVLVRAGWHGWEVHDALVSAGIAVQMESVPQILDDPVVIDLRSTLELLVDPTANVALARLLAGPRWRIGPRDLSALGARAEGLVGGRGREVDPGILSQLHEAVSGIDPADSVSLLEVVCGPLPSHDAMGAPLPALSPEAVTRLREFAIEFAALRAAIDEPVPEIVARTLTFTGLAVEAAVGDPHQVEVRQRAISAFLSLATEFTDLEGATGLPAFLGMLQAAERLDIRLEADDPPVFPDAVRVMTAHKAKGLEFEHVIVPFASKGSFPSGESAAKWTDSPSVVPLHLRADAPAALLDYPDRTQGPRAKDYDRFAGLHREHEALEETRLGYVALTRAEQGLAVTGHWWGVSGGKLRGPGELLLEARTLCPDGSEHLIAWAAEPDEADGNPLLRESAKSQPWPVVFDPLGVRMRAEAAAAVHAALAVPAALIVDAAMTSTDADRVASWDRDLPALVDEARRGAVDERVVRLPRALSASDYIRLAEDPARFAVDLARPMPHAPAPAARRGTKFHAWVETRFGQQSLLLPEDLPGAVDADVDSDERLRELKEAFERSEFAALTPIALEAPFAIVLAGRLIRGRIDAVFPAEHGIEVVDWKTGGPQGLHSLQLAIYRLAWAEQNDLPLEQVSALFHLVATNEIVRPAHLPDRAELERLLSAGD